MSLSTPVSPVNATHLPPGQDGYARERFSVQGTRVTLDPQRGWQCTCNAHVGGVHCLHIEQAQAYRKIRGARPEADTIELQFSAGQMQELSRAAEAGQTVIPSPGTVVLPTRVKRHSPWATVGIAAVMSVVSSGLTYLATARAPADLSGQPRTVPQHLAAAPAPQRAVPVEVPVKFINPFDATEVFEFPAGTTPVAARDAVAELLLNRARERRAETEFRLRDRKSAERVRPEHGVRLAESG
jgi:hypothetical protein